MSEIPGEVVDTVVELQRLLESEPDLCESLSRIARRACGSGRNDSARNEVVSSISMRIDGRQSTVTHHGAIARSLDRAQFDAGAGPGVDCLDLGRPIRVDLVEVDHEKWPAFVEAAAANGIRAAMSRPVVVEGSTVGALNIYCSESGLFLAAADRARGLADEVAAAITEAEIRWMVARLRRTLDEALGPAPAGVDVSPDCASSLARFAELVVTDRSLRLELRRIAGSAVSMLPRVDAATITLVLEGRPVAPASQPAVLELELATYVRDAEPHRDSVPVGETMKVTFPPTDEHHRVGSASPLGAVRPTVSYPVMTSGRSIGSLNLHCSAEPAGIETESEFQGRAISAAVASALVGSRLLSAADAFVAEVQDEAGRRRYLDRPGTARPPPRGDDSGSGSGLSETGADIREEVGR